MSAQSKASPTAICFTPESAGMARGTRCSEAAPSPTSPNWFFPQHRTVASLMRAHVTSPPAAICVGTADGPTTGAAMDVVGVGGA